MPIGYLAGVIVGGLLMISVITLTNRMNESSGQVSLYHTARIQHNNTTEWMTDELRKIGYRVQEIPVEQADSTSITFYYRRYDQSEPVRVRWYRENSQQSDRYILKREENGNTAVINHNLKDFYFSYRDPQGQKLSDPVNPQQIREIQLRVETEPADQWGRQPLSTRFETSIVPRNLNL